MRFFIIAAIAVGLSAGAAAGPKPADTPPSPELLKAAARAILAQSDSPQTSSQAKVSSAQQVDDASANAAMDQSCGVKKPTRKPTCPHPVSPN